MSIILTEVFTEQLFEVGESFWNRLLTKTELVSEQAFYGD